jgi:hypothetical protein
MGFHLQAIENALLLTGHVVATVRSSFMAGIDHPKPIRLFDISQATVKPTEDEKRHVHDCEECQTVIAIFARQFTSKKPPNGKLENAA